MVHLPSLSTTYILILVNTIIDKKNIINLDIHLDRLGGDRLIIIQVEIISDFFNTVRLGSGHRKFTARVIRFEPLLFMSRPSGGRSFAFEAVNLDLGQRADYGSVIHRRSSVNLY